MAKNKTTGTCMCSSVYPNTEVTIHLNSFTSAYKDSNRSPRSYQASSDSSFQWRAAVTLFHGPSPLIGFSCLQFCFEFCSFCLLLQFSQSPNNHVKLPFFYCIVVYLSINIQILTCPKKKKKGKGQSIRDSCPLGRKRVQQLYQADCWPKKLLQIDTSYELRVEQKLKIHRTCLWQMGEDIIGNSQVMVESYE